MRWVVRGLFVLIAIAVLLIVVVYGGSEWKIRQSHAVPLPQIAADTSPAGIAEGARFAAAAGCRGCHGPDGNGTVIADIPGVAHIAAPALAPIIARYSDAELARLIRHGIKRNGQGVYVMPIEGHANIADEDLSRIIGWMRTLKPSPMDRGDRLGFGPMGRFLILTGKVRQQVIPGVQAPAKRPADIGRYLAATVCGSCHHLTEMRPAHDDGRRVPPLIEIAPAYDPAPFKTLLRTGRGLSPRDLGLMGRVAKDDLVHLTDGEMDALHAYLRAEAARRPAK